MIATRIMHFSHDFELGKAEWGYHDDFISEEEEASLLEHFSELDFVRGDYLGRDIMRSQKWYQDDGEYFNHKWPVFDRWKSCGYTPIIRKFQDRISKRFPDASINSTLINCYQGDDIIPPHRDSEDVFGDNPTIVVVSLGATRTMRFSRVSPCSRSLKVIGKTYDIVLKPRSLFVMSGTTQKYFCHEILAPETKETTRYSMTFRHHTGSSGKTSKAGSRA